MLPTAPYLFDWRDPATWDKGIGHDDPFFQGADLGATVILRPERPIYREPPARGAHVTKPLIASKTIISDALPLPYGEPETGYLLKNRFLLEYVLGRGGMGVVFKARDLAREAVAFAEDSENYVAIKLLNDSFKQHPDSIKVLGREFTNTQKLAHPNIIKLYDFDRDDAGRYFIAMELLRGLPLDRLVAGLRFRGGLPFADAFDLVQQMANALAAAHNNHPQIVHSDFKSANVYIIGDSHVKVFDFGLARATRPISGDDPDDKTDFDLTRLGALTPAYASLEMLEGLEPEPRDDIYALALVTYELLTGRHPFGDRGTALVARQRRLDPRPVKSLTARQWRGLRRGLQLERINRPAHVEQFIDELRPRRWFFT